MEFGNVFVNPAISRSLPPVENFAVSLSTLLSILTTAPPLIFGAKPATNQMISDRSLLAPEPDREEVALN